MPELPEVETVRRGLLPAMEVAMIARAEVRAAGLRWPFPPRMAERLRGQWVTSLRRRSKYILADLSGGEVLLIHLGMSGRIIVAQDGPPEPQKHDHVILTMDSGARITFNDARRFGTVDLMAAADEAAHPLLARLGPEPLGNGFDSTWLASRFAGRRTPVKSALLDQGHVAGLGNIYVCEILHRARIHPARIAGDLPLDQVDRLVPLIRQVLTEAIDAGGSSLRDYRQADGELGYFQHAFRVYGREGAPCTAPGCNGNVARIVQSGRSSFFCTQCQH